MEAGTDEDDNETRAGRKTRQGQQTEIKIWSTETAGEVLGTVTTEKCIMVGVAYVVVVVLSSKSWQVCETRFYQNGPRES